MKEGGVVMAQISQLKKIPGRQRNLTAEEKKELRDNMASMGRIITPIVVEPEFDGVYAIIAGNNRFDNAVELGWETLPIFVFNGEPEENEDAAFYSNLMHPSLPDYEKYLGLKKIMARDGKSQSELVKLTGLDVDLESLDASAARFTDQVREAVSREDVHHQVALLLVFGVQVAVIMLGQRQGGHARIVKGGWRGNGQEVVHLADAAGQRRG